MPPLLLLEVQVQEPRPLQALTATATAIAIQQSTAHRARAAIHRMQDISIKASDLTSQQALLSLDRFQVHQI